jgi:hypothetical protein
MPDPKDFSDKKKYMDECMHQTRKVEKKPQDESVAICLNRWREEKGGKKSAHDLLRGIAKRIVEHAQ